MKKILDLYITKVCNLNCEYCYVDLSSEEDQKFSGEDFLNRKNLLDYDDIRFFGGEPLIRWDDIVKIIESVHAKKPEITFVIVSNGLLIDKEKIDFCKKFNVKFVISVHEKGIMHLSKKLPLFLDIKHNVTFSFLFLPENISYPLKNILGFIAQGFHNFIILPEIYSDWNKENIMKLSQELNKFILLKKKIPQACFGQLSGDVLKKISTGCEKTIVDHHGTTTMCNRFKSMNTYKDISYQKIYKHVNNIIHLNDNPDKWFYACPIGQYFDFLTIYGEDVEKINEGLKKFDYLNKLLVNFFRELNEVEGKTNFLSKEIDEIRFNLTNQCNLRCEYCYVDFNNKTLELEVAKNIIDFYIMQEGERKVISFFGGEPLLEFRLLQDLVEYAQEKALLYKKTLKFKIATNFLLVNTEKALFLKEHDFDVHISLNGTKNLNDTMRNGSTDVLLKNLLKYKDIIGVRNIVILLAFSNKEVASLFKSVYFIHKLGFSLINLEMIFGKKYLWTDQDLLILEEELRKIKKVNIVQLANEHSIKNHRKILDISPDGKASDNSFAFHKYEVEFHYKNIFDQKLRLIFT